MSNIEILQEMVDAMACRLGVESAILVVKDPNGFNAMVMNGLASASHMVLLGHDAAVLAGAAGPELQAAAERLPT